MDVRICERLTQRQNMVNRRPANLVLNPSHESRVTVEQWPNDVPTIWVERDGCHIGFMHVDANGFVS